MDASLELGKKTWAPLCVATMLLFIFFSRNISCIFFGSLSGFGLLQWQQWHQQRALRLALIPLLFIACAVKLVSRVISSQLDGELREVRGNQ